MKILTLLLLSVSAFAQCGVERHAVKDLMDGVTVTPPENSTVTQLRGLVPMARITNELPRQPEETKSYRLSAWLLGYKLETDQDYHVVISEVGHKDQTMVVEIPSPGCAPSSGLAVLFLRERHFIDSVFGVATPKFKHLKRPVAIKVSGMLFFDRVHGQTGVAPNGVELHPVLTISK